MNVIHIKNDKHELDAIYIPFSDVLDLVMEYCYIQGYRTASLHSDMIPKYFDTLTPTDSDWECATYSDSHVAFVLLEEKILRVYNIEDKKAYVEFNVKKKQLEIFYNIVRFY